jgi:hypothetical protein
MHLPTVVFLGPALVCALSWLGAGLAVPRALLSGELLLDWLTRFASGSVAVSLAVLALGRLDLLQRPLVAALTAAGALAGVVALRPLATGIRGVRPHGRPERILLGAVAVAIALDLLAATAPVTSADALKYHLALPKLWLELGSVGDPFWRWEGFNPSGIEMLFTQGLALGGASTAAALHAVLAAACAAAVYGLGRELAGSREAGAAAAFLFVLQGIVTWEATSSFIELGLTFYATLGSWYALRWARAPQRSAAVWLGFFAGAAAGAKYLGLAAAAALLGACGLTALVRRRAGQVLLMGSAAALAGGWWYLKNAIVAGNPVYPLLFGGKWLTPELARAIRRGYSAPGSGGGIVRLAILPLDLLRHGGAFDRGQYVGTAIFVLALLALLVERRLEIVVVLALVAAYLVVWHLESPQARFLLPALAVLAAVGGGAAAAWLRAGAVRRGAVMLVLAASAAAWLAASVALTRQLVPVTVGAEAHGRFLERLTGTYDAFRLARRHAGPGTVALAGYPFTFNFPGRAVSLGLPEFFATESRPLYIARLRSLDVRAILVGGDPSKAAEIAPVRSCLRPAATYHARYVTSRSLAHSVPYTLRLYSLRGCGR